MRWTSSTPSVASSCLMTAEKVGWLTPHCSAALPKFCSRARAMRNSSLSIMTSFLVAQRALQEATHSLDRVLGSSLVVFQPMAMEPDAGRKQQSKGIECIVGAGIDDQVHHCAIPRPSRDADVAP